MDAYASDGLIVEKKCIVWPHYDSLAATIFAFLLPATTTVGVPTVREVVEDEWHCPLHMDTCQESHQSIKYYSHSTKGMLSIFWVNAFQK